MKIIIELRDFDLNNNKLDNKNAVEEITNHVNKYWDCESVEVLE